MTLSAIKSNFLALLAAFAVFDGLWAQEPIETEYTPEKLHSHFQQTAEDYDIEAGGDSLKLRPQPLMHWQNTARKQEQGALFLWEKDGRPQVLGSIFTYQLGDAVRCRHEMISLSETPLTARLGGTTVWSPKTHGVTWKPLSDLGAPESPARRMTQMRSLAREFVGTLRLPDQQPSSLTLIPQPVVRYRAPKAGVVDGAVFSMAVVTDPEIFLMIEAKEGKGDGPQWFYAVARAHYHQLELQRDGKTVWSQRSVVELERTSAGQRPWSLQPYFIFNPPRPLPPPEQL